MLPSSFCLLALLFIDKHSERLFTFATYSYSLLIYFWPPSSLVFPLSLHCSDSIWILLYLYIDTLEHLVELIISCRRKPLLLTSLNFSCELLSLFFSLTFSWICRGDGGGGGGGVGCRCLFWPASYFVYCIWILTLGLNTI